MNNNNILDIKEITYKKNLHKGKEIQSAVCNVIVLQKTMSGVLILTNAYTLSYTWEGEFSDNEPLVYETNA